MPSPTPEPGPEPHVHDSALVKCGCGWSRPGLTDEQRALLIDAVEGAASIGLHFPALCYAFGLPEHLAARPSPDEPPSREAFLADGPWQQMSDAATPGPWEVTEKRGKRDGYIKGAGRTVADMRLRNGSADAALIVAAVNFIRAALRGGSPNAR